MLPPRLYEAQRCKAGLACKNCSTREIGLPGDCVAQCSNRSGAGLRRTLLCRRDGTVAAQQTQQSCDQEFAALRDRVVGRSLHIGVPRCNLGGLHIRILMTE